jgi:hypothetical protein
VNEEKIPFPRFTFYVTNLVSIVLEVKLSRHVTIKLTDSLLESRGTLLGKEVGEVATCHQEDQQ